MLFRDMFEAKTKAKNFIWEFGAVTKERGEKAEVPSDFFLLCNSTGSPVFNPEEGETNRAKREFQFQTVSCLLS